jgi:hypothetical protein
MREILRNNGRTHFLARRDGERGVAMVSTLAVIVILGIVVTVVISNSSSGPPSTKIGGSAVGTTTTTSVKSIGSDATASAISACLASYSEVNTALTYYKTLNGDSPPAGTAWATSATNGSALIESWPSGTPYYAITWNGAELSVIPKRGVPSHGTFGASSPRSGCYAA